MNYSSHVSQAASSFATQSNNLVAEKHNQNSSYNNTANFNPTNFHPQPQIINNYSSRGTSLQGTRTAPLNASGDQHMQKSSTIQSQKQVGINNQVSANRNSITSVGTNGGAEPSVERLKSCIADLKKLATTKVKKSSSYGGVTASAAVSNSMYSRQTDRDQPRPPSYRQATTYDQSHQNLSKTASTSHHNYTSASQSQKRQNRNLNEQQYHQSSNHNTSSDQRKHSYKIANTLKKYINDIENTSNNVTRSKPTLESKSQSIKDSARKPAKRSSSQDKPSARKQQISQQHGVQSYPSSQIVNQSVTHSSRREQSANNRSSPKITYTTSISQINNGLSHSGKYNSSGVIHQPSHHQSSRQSNKQHSSSSQQKQDNPATVVQSSVIQKGTTPYQTSIAGIVHQSPPGQGFNMIGGVQTYQTYRDQQNMREAEKTDDVLSRNLQVPKQRASSHDRVGYSSSHQQYASSQQVQPVLNNQKRAQSSSYRPSSSKTKGASGKKVPSEKKSSPQLVNNYIPTSDFSLGVMSDRRDSKQTTQQSLRPEKINAQPSSTVRYNEQQSFKGLQQSQSQATTSHNQPKRQEFSQERQPHYDNQPISRVTSVASTNASVLYQLKPVQKEPSYLERQYQNLKSEEGLQQAAAKLYDEHKKMLPTDLDLQQAQPMSSTIYSAQQATIPPGGYLHASVGSSILVQNQTNHKNTFSSLEDSIEDVHTLVVMQIQRGRKMLRFEQTKGDRKVEASLQEKYSGQNLIIPSTVEILGSDMCSQRPRFLSQNLRQSRSSAQQSQQRQQTKKQK